MKKSPQRLLTYVYIMSTLVIINSQGFFAMAYEVKYGIELPPPNTGSLADDDWFFNDRTAAGRMRKDVYDLVVAHREAGHGATTARFIFYELVAAGKIAKDRGDRPDKPVIDALTALRETGRIPWSAVEDGTRRVEDFTGYSSIAEAVRAALYADLDIWDGVIPLLLCESRSLLGALRPVCEKYRIFAASTNGQTAGFLHTRVNRILEPGSTVLYFGDNDFAGGHIEANSRAVLEKEVGELDWQTLALTDEQIKLYDLPIIQKHDGRTRRLHDAVECEALGQQRLIDILEEALQDMLPHTLDAIEGEADRQRAKIREVLDQLDDDSKGGDNG
jgi:hypothetical protein